MYQSGQTAVQEVGIVTWTQLVWSCCTGNALQGAFSLQQRSAVSLCASSPSVYDLIDLSNDALSL